MFIKILKIVLLLVVFAILADGFSSPSRLLPDILFIIFLLLLSSLFSKNWKAAGFLSVLIGILGIIMYPTGELAGAAILFCSIPFIIIPILIAVINFFLGLKK